MARQRLRAETTWKLAKAEHKKARRELAAVGMRGEAVNTVAHWKLVGRYQVLEELLWEVDK